MQPYRHTQHATAILLGVCGTAAATLAVGGGVLLATGFREAAEIAAVLGIVLLVLVPVAIAFSSLTVEVTPERLAFWFGPGWIRRSYPLREVAGARAVRNHWIWGWGIRWTPRGWLFNVSGLDAVEVELAGGKRFQIGTDEPRELEAAIRRAVGEAR